MLSWDDEVAESGSKNLAHVMPELKASHVPEQLFVPAVAENKNDVPDAGQIARRVNAAD